MGWSRTAHSCWWVPCARHEATFIENTSSLSRAPQLIVDQYRRKASSAISNRIKHPHKKTVQLELRMLATKSRLIMALRHIQQCLSNPYEASPSLNQSKLHASKMKCHPSSISNHSRKVWRHSKVWCDVCTYLPRWLIHWCEPFKAQTSSIISISFPSDLHTTKRTNPQGAWLGQPRLAVSRTPRQRNKDAKRTMNRALGSEDSKAYWAFLEKAMIYPKRDEKNTVYPSKVCFGGGSPEQKWNKPSPQRPKSTPPVKDLDWDRDGQRGLWLHLSLGGLWLVTSLTKKWKNHIVSQILCLSHPTSFCQSIVGSCERLSLTP